MLDIRPVVLCGGTGSRLWPMSRAQSPKQFQPVAGKGSLTFFQATLQRHRAKGYGKPVVVTADQHRETVARQLEEIQCDATIILEPMARNTGPAVLAAAMILAEEDPSALMLILPSDHVIAGNLTTPIFAMRKAASDGKIVTFGIKPSYPETGYGYIVDAGASDDYDGLHHVAEFVEKPPLAKAAALIDTGAAYWASGISLYAASTIIEEFARLDLATSRSVRLAVDRGEWTGKTLMLHPHSFRRATAEPTERIVFEKARSVALAPLDVEWSDVGCWTSMHAIGAADEDGNVLQGDVISINTHNSLVRSDKRLIAVVNMSNVIVVDTPDAVLVTSRGKCQDVKQVVDTLKLEARREIVHHTARNHFWGQSHQVFSSAAYDMTVLKIDAGSSLTIEPLPGGQIFTDSGGLGVFDGFSRRNPVNGERIPLDSNKSMVLTNTSEVTVEAILVTVNGPTVKDVQLDRVANG